MGVRTADYLWDYEVVVERGHLLRREVVRGLAVEERRVVDVVRRTGVRYLRPRLRYRVLDLAHAVGGTARAKFADSWEEAARWAERVAASSPLCSCWECLRRGLARAPESLRVWDCVASRDFGVLTRFSSPCGLAVEERRVGMAHVVPGGRRIVPELVYRVVRDLPEGSYPYLDDRERLVEAAYCRSWEGALERSQVLAAVEQGAS